MDVIVDTMMEKIARCFSSHRFDDAAPHLADDVVWTVVGQPPMVGRKAVEKAIKRTSEDLAKVTTEFQRFRSVVGEDSVVVESLARYTDNETGDVSIVASCDIYDFDNEERISEVVSYTIELPS